MVRVEKVTLKGEKVTAKVTPYGGWSNPYKMALCTPIGEPSFYANQFPILPIGNTKGIEC